MKRELLLLRHGKSDWGQPVDDQHRPLKERGKRAAERIGVWLRRQEKRPEMIISSPAVRAQETARLVAGQLGIAERMIQVEPAIYEAHWRDLLTTVRSLPRKRKRIMLVGHNTSMEELLLYLADGRVRPAANGKIMPTATLGLFLFQGSWKKLSPERVADMTVIRPRELTDP
jgi:phosphohistidine phosphatase